MRFVLWVMNAARRTTIAWLPALARPDDRFARERLSPAEYRLYRRMDPRDRQHGCEVARRLLRAHPNAPDRLVRAALLHDVGKVVMPYNPLHRVAVHLWTPRHLPARPLSRGLRGAWQVKLHHHRYGADLIRRAGGSPEVAELVERHHDPRGDTEAELLSGIDGET